MDMNDFGFEDIDIGNIDEILECGDDLIDIEQTAFMGSSKIMLKMIDNMLYTIDTRIDNGFNQYDSDPQQVDEQMPSQFQQPRMQLVESW